MREVFWRRHVEWFRYQGANLSHKRFTEDQVLESASVAILKDKIDVVIIRLRVVDLDEEGELGVELIEFEENLLLDERLVQFVDLRCTRITLMICFLEIFLMATCSPPL